MTTGRSWHSIHVHHHGEATSRLVAEAVQPVSRELDRRGHPTWFVRHWRRGPHLRLHVEASESELHGVVVPAVAAVLDPYLATLPTTVTDVDGLLPLHRRLAEWEQDQGPLTPWFPDNSWHVDAYDDRMAVHRTPEAAALVTGFLRDANDHAFAVTTAAVAGASLPAAVFDTMVTMADRLVYGGIANGYLSFRSHTESYLSVEARGPEWRRVWAEYYQKHARTLAARLDRLVAPGSTGDPESTMLVDLIARYWSLGAGLYARGLLPALRLDDLDRRRELAEAGTSPFHRELLRNDFWRTQVGPSADFANFRLALNLMYLQFTRLGITPHQRYFLCYLVAEAVESHTGRSWTELMRSWETPAAGVPA